jgi:hypothetical protein
MFVVDVGRNATYGAAQIGGAMKNKEQEQTNKQIRVRTHIKAGFTLRANAIEVDEDGFIEEPEQYTKG